MKVALPNAVAKGCWFHYGQAIYRKISRELIALALLPANDILEGILFSRYIILFSIILIVVMISNCSLSLDHPGKV